jgi:hypothetical protein
VNHQLGKEGSLHLPTIGEMIVAWALFEHRLDVTIYNLVNAGPKECACITSQLRGTASRFQVIIDLCNLQQIPEYLIKELDNINQDGVALSKRRNRYIHDPWFVDNETGGGVQLFKNYVQNELSWKIHEVPLPDIKAFIADVGGIDYRIGEIRTRILQHLSLKHKEILWERNHIILFEVAALPHA